MLNMKQLGIICKKYRKRSGYYQIHVANDTEYSVENISAFENGRNDNCRILLWYIEHGLTLEEIRGS